MPRQLCNFDQSKAAWSRLTNSFANRWPHASKTKPQKPRSTFFAAESLFLASGSSGKAQQVITQHDEVNGSAHSQPNPTVSGSCVILARTVNHSAKMIKLNGIRHPAQGNTRKKQSRVWRHRPHELQARVSSHSCSLEDVAGRAPHTRWTRQSVPVHMYLSFYLAPMKRRSHGFVFIPRPTTWRRG